MCIVKCAVTNFSPDLNAGVIFNCVLLVCWFKRIHIDTNKCHMVSENRQFPQGRMVMVLFSLVFFCFLFFFLLVAVSMFDISGNNSSVSLFLFPFQARGNTVWRWWVLRLCLISSVTSRLAGSSLNWDVDVFMHPDCSSVPSILHSSAAASLRECFKPVTQLFLGPHL